MDNQNHDPGADQGGTDSGQERTFTQEEVNAIIGERLAKEKSKYADYADLKEKAEKFDAYEEKNKSELEKAQEKSASLQAELDTLKKKAAAEAVRAKVASEKGVPASLLHGDDEETCMKEADKLLEFAKPTVRKRIRDGGDPHRSGSSGKTSELFADWFNENMN